ncbi:hypothetical protein D3C72_1088840 [compost metagenome]
MHRQAHHLTSNLVTDRQLSGSVSHCGLLVQRNRVVHGCRYTGLLQPSLYSIPVLDTNGVLRICTDIVRFDKWGRFNARLGEKTIIVIGHLLAQGYLLLEDLELGQQDGCLQGVQPAIHTDANMVITTILTMARDLTKHGCKLVVIRENGTAIAIATQWLAWEEAGAGYSRKIAGALPFIGRAKALGCVLDDRDTVLGSDNIDRIEISALTIQGYRNDRLGTGSDRCLEQCRVEVVGTWVYIHIHGLRPQQCYCFSSCYIGEAGGDDLIARADIQRHLSNLQSIGTICASDAVFRTDKLSQARFQLCHFRAEDVLPMVQYALDARVDLVFDARLLAFQVNEFNHVQTSTLFRVPSLKT